MSDAIGHLTEEINRLEGEKEELIRQVISIDGAFRKYAQHEADCSINHPLYAHEGCTCGLQDILDSKG